MEAEANPIFSLQTQTKCFVVVMINTGGWDNITGICIALFFVNALSDIVTFEPNGNPSCYFHDSHFKSKMSAGITVRECLGTAILSTEVNQENLSFYKAMKNLLCSFSTGCSSLGLAVRTQSFL